MGAAGERKTPAQATAGAARPRHSAFIGCSSPPGILASEVIDMVLASVLIVAFCWLLMAGLGLISVAWLRDLEPERVRISRNRTSRDR
jgi:hypothetical protein